MKLNSRVAAAGAVAVISLAGVAGVAGAANAASASGHAVPTTATTPASKLTVSAKPTTVRRGQAVTLTGKGPARAPLQVQEKIGKGAWTNIAATGRVSGRGTYLMKVVSNIAGPHQYRLTSGRLVSPSVSVTVSR